MVGINEIKSEDVWERFVTSFPGANFLQSYAWGEFHMSLGKQIFRDGFYRNGKLIGVMLSITETAKRASYLTIPAGPLINWEDKSVVNKAVARMMELAKSSRCSFIRIRPQLFNTETNRKKLQNLGFRSAPFHLHVELTLKLSLEKNDEQLFSEMRKATRYELKQAMKMGIEIEESCNPGDIDEFYKLQVQTAKRQDFVPFSLSFLKNQFEKFVERDQAKLYTARFGGKVLAQAMIIFYGQEANYHYGAGTAEGRKYPGAYLLMWRAISDAKKRGLKYYDLWGIAPEGAKQHRFYGVSVFKRGFGGYVVEYLSARDLVINKYRYFINYVIEVLRKKFRKL